MNNKFKIKKFHKDDAGVNWIRFDVLQSGKIIAFGIALTDLMNPSMSKKIDFDKLSDSILEKFYNSNYDHLF